VVENPERLRMLLILTVADIRAVGPGVWNGWKGQLMRELFGATEAIFRGGRGGDPAASFARHLEATAGEARAALIAQDPSAAAWAASMEDAYFAGFSREDLTAHAALARRTRTNGGAAAQAQIRADLNAAEIAVAADDRRGLFADVAQVFAAVGANVVGAKAHTSRGGQALDVFFLQDGGGGPYGYDSPRALERLAGLVETAARGEGVPDQPKGAADFGRTAAFSIIPTVAVDNDASEEASVIEVSGRDRAGLLGALAVTLAGAGLSIQSAHVDNYGERAVDAFYVVDDEGQKLTNPRRIVALKTALTEVLADEAGEAPAGRLRLQRARASIAR
jgi:[protein-PII] uridylyltransferase